jgi:hypothetical protein
VDAPDWFCAGDTKDLATYMRGKYELVTKDHLLAVCRSGNGIVSIQILHLLAANAGCQLVSDLSDEAVECIGREDVVRMVECVGYAVTKRYFDKNSGLV